jgi:hypothetical protein
MFFVSFHGGSATKQVKNPINNVFAYDDDGNQLAANILDAGNTTRLDELRGLYLVPGTGTGTGTLYVVNGSKHTSNILTFSGSGTSYGSPEVFASAETTPAIDHPFAAAFDGNSRWYISNQDTNVVVTLTAAAGSSPAGAAPASAASVGGYLDALYPKGEFLAGTLIASAIDNLPSVQVTTKVPKELGGLDALLVLDSGESDDAAGASTSGTGGTSGMSSTSNKSKVQHSVRDVQYAALSFNGETLALLFVVDEAAALVRIYDPSSGQPLRCSNPLPASPTHLLIDRGTVYVGVGNQVLSSPLPNPYDPTAPVWVLTPIPSLSNLPGDVSDMAFDSAGSFHVAIRTKNQVIKYDATFENPVPWASAMTDSPEFLLYVPDAASSVSRG